MHFLLISKNTKMRSARQGSTSTKLRREECQTARTNSPLQPQCDGISARSVGAISVGIPPFLTLSQKPSALRDKSGESSKSGQILHRFKTSLLDFPLDQATILQDRKST